MADSLDQQLLLGYIEGDLDADDQARVQQSLREDPRLAALVAEMVADREALRQMPEPTPPPWLMDEVDRQLEREMLMANLPQGNGREAGRQRHVLRSIFTGSAVAAMLAIVGGLIFESVTGVNPAREIAGQLGMQGEQSPAVAMDDRDEDDQSLVEDQSTPAVAEGEDEAVGEGTTEGDTTADARPLDVAQTPELSSFDDLDATALLPRTTVSPSIEPQAPDAEALVDDSLARITAMEPADPSQPTAEAELEPPALEVDVPEVGMPVPDALREAGLAAASITANDAMATEQEAPAHARLVPDVGRAIDPLAVTPEHPTQLPGEPSAVGIGTPGLPAGRQPKVGAEGDVSARLEMDPFEDSGGLGQPLELATPGPFEADREDQSEGRVQLRALLDRMVLAQELELRIEAADRAAVLETLEQFGSLPEGIGEAEDSARAFDLAIERRRVGELLDALEQRPGVGEVALNRQPILAAGELPGGGGRQTPALDLWPSLVPDYEAILRHRMPREEVVAEPPVDLPVRIVAPSPATDDAE